MFWIKSKTVLTLKQDFKNAGVKTHWDEEKGGWKVGWLEKRAE